MKGSAVQTYTVSITGSGALADRFERMLDVLPASAMEGGEDHGAVTLWFDVRARNREQAIERAHLRVVGAVRIEDAVTVAIVRSHTVEGRRPWWRRVLSR